MRSATAGDGGDAEMMEVGVAEARGSDSAHVFESPPRKILYDHIRQLWIIGNFQLPERTNRALQEGYRWSNPSNLTTVMHSLPGSRTYSKTFCLTQVITHCATLVFHIPFPSSFSLSHL